MRQNTRPHRLDRLTVEDGIRPRLSPRQAMRAARTAIIVAAICRGTGDRAAAAANLRLAGAFRASAR